MLIHHRPSETHEIYTRERCYITEVLNCDNSPDLSIARCRVEVGMITELHSLTGVAETYLINAGEGVMDDGINPPITVGVGDSITIPAGHPQRIKNIGESDLLFTVTCRPRFASACYVPLD